MMATNEISINIHGIWKIKLLSAFIKLINSIPSFGGKKGNMKISIEIKVS